MKPYYEEGGITIYHGDCREVLPGLGSVDLALTDPPYGVGVEYGTCSSDTDAYVSELAATVIPTLRRLAPTVLVTCGTRNLFAYPRPDWVLSWVQPASAGMCAWGFATWQPILAYGSDPYLRARMGSRADTIIRNAQGLGVARDRAAYGHPCPKPLPAWALILKRGSARPGDTVLDPFMGSGTTLRAAKDLGRKAIGIEIEERYCEIAAKRLGQGVLFGASA